MNRRNALKLFGAAFAGTLLLEDKAVAAAPEQVTVPTYDRPTFESIRDGRLKPTMQNIDDVIAWFKHCEGWIICSCDHPNRLRMGWAFFKNKDDCFGWNPTIRWGTFMRSADAKGKEFSNKVRELLETDEGRYWLTEFFKDMARKSDHGFPQT
jgi:hypothetical protein